MPVSLRLEKMPIALRQPASISNLAFRVLSKQMEDREDFPGHHISKQLTSLSILHITGS
jgi:hypothetical protein